MNTMNINTHNAMTHARKVEQAIKYFQAKIYSRMTGEEITLGILENGFQYYMDIEEVVEWNMLQEGIIPSSKGNETMTHKEMVQEAITELTNVVGYKFDNQEIQEYILFSFYSHLSTGEISDIRNEIDNPILVATVGEYVKPKTSQEVRSIRRHIGQCAEYECSECNREITLQEYLFNQGHCDECTFSVD